MTTTTRTRDAALDMPWARRPRLGMLAFGFVLTILAAAVLAAAFAIGLGEAFAARVMPGVSVAGVELAGLDRAAAETRLREQLPPLHAGTLTLTVEADSRAIPYRAFGRDYDVNAMLDSALRVGRGELGPLADAVEQIGSLIRGTEIEPAVRLDTAALRAELAAAVAGLERIPRDATVVLDAEAGTFNVTPSAIGRTTDLDAAIGAALAAVTTAEPSSASIALPARPVAPRVSSDAAQAAADEATAMTSRPLALTVGEASFTIAPEALRSWVGFEAAADGSLAIALAEPPIVEAIEGLRGKIDTSPRNASFKTGDGRVTGVIAGVNGRRLDAEASAAQIRDLLADTGPGSPAPSLALALAVVEPDVTTEEAEAVAPKMRRISSWSTYFQVSEKNFFGKNISVPTSIIDGTVVAPGDSFSFWETVGEVNEERGFGPGGAIINGRTEPTGAIAGGICSCSTTLFNAALRAGYEMGDRRNHFYYISRYPKGLDATVFKSDYSEQDMTWRNDTEYPVVIRGVNATGVVTFELYSVDPGRRVVLTDPIVKNPRPARDTIEYTSKLRPGQRERVEHPADGFDAWVTRRVYQGDKVIHRETYYSHYARVDGVVQVGR